MVTNSHTNKHDGSQYLLAGVTSVFAYRSGFLHNFVEVCSLCAFWFILFYYIFTGWMFSFSKITSDINVWRVTFIKHSLQ